MARLACLKKPEGGRRARKAAGTSPFGEAAHQVRTPHGPLPAEPLLFEQRKVGPLASFRSTDSLATAPSARGRRAAAAAEIPCRIRTCIALPSQETDGMLFATRHLANRRSRRVCFMIAAARVWAGLTTEGLYRVSGNKTDQDNIQKQFDQGDALAPPARQASFALTRCIFACADPSVDLLALDVAINAAAGALKAFSADLPDPLIPYALHPELVQAASKSAPATASRPLAVLLRSTLLPDMAQV